MKRLAEGPVGATTVSIWRLLTASKSDVIRYLYDQACLQVVQSDSHRNHGT